MRVEGRIYQVTDDDKEKLIAKFSYNEIREAIFSNGTQQGTWSGWFPS